MQPCRSPATYVGERKPQRSGSRWRRGDVHFPDEDRSCDGPEQPGRKSYNSLPPTSGISPVPQDAVVGVRSRCMTVKDAISRGLASGRSLRAISAGLGSFAPSTISREVTAPWRLRAQYRASPRPIV